MKKLFFFRLSGSFQPLTTALVAISLVLLSGCEKLPLHPELAGPAVNATTTQAAKGENPFSVTIMRQAYANLLDLLWFDFERFSHIFVEIQTRIRLPTSTDNHAH